MQTKSRPAALSALAKVTASSGVSPPSIQSSPVMRAPSGMALPAQPRAPPWRPRAESACAPRASRHSRRCACWRSARQSCAGDSRARACSSMASKPIAHRAPRRGDEGLAHALHVGRRHLARYMPVRTERDRRWRDRLPGILARRERTAAFPGPRGRGLASGMPDLDAELGGAVAAAMRHHPRQARPRNRPSRCRGTHG